MRLKNVVQEICFVFETGQTLTRTNFLISSPNILNPETVNALKKLKNDLESFKELPVDIEFSIDNLKKKINAELHYLEIASLPDQPKEI